MEDADYSSNNKVKKKIKVISNIEQDEKTKKRLQKNIKYLLSQSIQFSKYFKEKFEEHMYKSKELEDDDISTNSLLSDDEPFLTDNLDVTKQLKYFEGGTLKPYQVEGLAWMTILFENGVSGILADEMGLGKTVQVIALICHLYERGVEGPYLIIAPLSTIPNWVSEFKRFAPKIPVVLYYGNQSERQGREFDMRANYTLGNYRVKPVIITTYQIPLITMPILRKQSYQYLIVDEGHRLKNHTTKLSMELRTLNSANKLLLTGTPLQNNMTELWSLLNFILPHIFKDINAFSSFILMEDIEDNNFKSTDLITTLHQVLAPFMLRRKKVDVLDDHVPKKEVLVYCPLSELQRTLYKNVLEKNIALLKDPNAEIEEEDTSQRKRRRCTMTPKKFTEVEEDDIFYISDDDSSLDSSSVPTKTFIARLTMQNPMMMFRKIVNHPYLVHFPLNPESTVKELLVTEELVKSSGKMLVLEAMLSKLHAQGHKVIIFTTLVMTLEVVEEFLLMRGYQYRSLHGSLNLEQRRLAIDDFNKDPNIFIFICSTRAGGLGINLTAADTVIFFDRDWNPQADIQAQDRCHRIGQTKPVMIFTLVTKNTIDDKIIASASAKRKLEKVVIKDGKFKNIVPKKSNFDFEELQRILESSDIAHTIHSNGFVFTDDELNALLDRTELFNEMKQTKS